MPIPDRTELGKCTAAIAEKDLPVLVSAFLCQADYLVTGDHKDFGKVRDMSNLPVKIVSPAEAVRIMGFIAADHMRTS